MIEQNNKSESGSNAASMGLTLGSAPAAAPAKPALRPAAREKAPAAKQDKQGWWWATGRRKTAVARVRLHPGSGTFRIQVSKKVFRDAAEYFTELRDREDINAPMKLTGTLGKLDVIARVAGGGYMGQAQAVRLGVARALSGLDPSLESALRDAGFLTRDPREVERKKPGQAGARRRFQFSKR